MSVPATQHMPEQGASNRRILVILAVVVAAMVVLSGHRLWRDDPGIR